MGGSTRPKHGLAYREQRLIVAQCQLQRQKLEIAAVLAIGVSGLLGWNAGTGWATLEIRNEILFLGTCGAF
jgi:hypothetical protein